MPGFIGFTDKQRQYGEKTLRKMRDLLKHFDANIPGPLFHNESVWLSRMHVDTSKQDDQPFICEGRYYWLEGEFYNQKDLQQKYHLSCENDNELFARIYQQTQSFEFLQHIDGCYVAVIYDSKKRKIYFINDRHGLMPLYWGMVKGDLIWSSELKGVLGHCGFTPRVDREALRQFLDIGYLLEERSWFEGIELLPPGSILIYDIPNSSHEIKCYWAWEKIKPLDGKLDEEAIVEELGRLFLQSVERRIQKGERVGVSLSGGLDSRAIYAAIPKAHQDLPSFTFGIKGCDDIAIAKQVTSIRKTAHHVFHIDALNWLFPRINAIWRADGMLNLIHMHGIEFHESCKKFMDVQLNGFLGDATIGGFYLECDPKDSEYYTLRNRGRRHVNQALILIQNNILQRRPFYDNQFLELVFSIPASFRRRSRIYKKMLLDRFPDYFDKIPWQKTGLCIAAPEFISTNLKLFKAANSRLRKIMRIGKLNTHYYSDYSSWIREEPARSFFEQQLTGHDCLYPEYISKNKVEQTLRSHMKGADLSESLGRYLTFEIWLQQVFNNQYRSG